MVKWEKEEIKKPILKDYKIQCRPLAENTKGDNE